MKPEMAAILDPVWLLSKMCITYDLCIIIGSVYYASKHYLDAKIRFQSISKFKIRRH